MSKQPHITRFKLKFRYGWFLLCVFLTACASPIKPLDQSNQVRDLKFKTTDLKFKTIEIGNRFRAFDTCLRQFETNADWKYNDYQKGGNFYEATWCRGANIDERCTWVNPDMTRDVHWIRNYTLFYDLPNVFGAGISAFHNPSDAGGWGASLGYVEEGSNIVGDGFSLDFRLYQPLVGDKNSQANAPIDKFSVGSRADYKLIDFSPESISTNLQTPPPQLLKSYFASPEMFRQQSLDVLQQLETKVIDSINSHQLRKKTYLPRKPEDKGAPIPMLNELSESEEKVELEKAQLYFTAQKQLLAKNYQEMYKALNETFPLAQCVLQKEGFKN